MARAHQWTLASLSVCLLGLVACMPEPYSPPQTGGTSGGTQGSAGRGGGSGTAGTGGSNSGTGGGGGSTTSGGGGSSATGGAPQTGGSGGSSQGGRGGGGSPGGSGGTGATGGSSSSGSGGSGGAADSGTGGAEAPAAPAAPRLSTDVLPVLKMRCALGGCHDPIKVEHGMNLSTAATVYSSWVNKPTSDHCRGNMAVVRVVPGKPETSFVVTLIEAQPGRCADQARMPPAPRPVLPPAEVKIIRDWIAAGAKND